MSAINHRCTVLYDCTFDYYKLSLVSSTKNKEVRIKTGLSYMRWAKISEINKVVYFFENWHKFADTIQEDMVYEQSVILPNLVRYINENSSRKISEYTIPSSEGMREIPLNLVTK